MFSLMNPRMIWLGLPLIWAMLTFSSWYWNADQVKSAYYNNMATQGREIFRIIEAARLWNAQHGGVYGLRSASSPSNPYLEAPEKDIKTPGGKPLTLINPAYMTRQLSEIILDQTGIRIHITSLKPINPKNQPNEWEAQALKSFENDIKEYFDVASHSAQFMRPLVTRQACLTCHAKQGYKVGDIRGGISVSFDASTYLASIGERIRDLTLIHLFIWLLLSILSVTALSIIRRQFQAISAAKHLQDELVEQRTSELRKEMRDRQEAESFLRMLVHSSGEAMFGVDKDGRCNFINPAALRLLGYNSAEDVHGMSLLTLVQTGAETNDNQAFSACRALKQGEHIYDPAGQFVRADGSTFPVEYRSHPIFSKGEIVGAVTTFDDISHRKAEQEAIWFKANHDALTGLPNRDLLEDRMDNAISQARRHGGEVAVLFIDLDKFKEANDRFGHAAGDLILQETASRMRRCVRETDTVARLGGDEFVVLMPMPIEQHDAECSAQRIVDTLCEPFIIGTESAEISASVGIALFPEHGDNHNEILRHADSAMYLAKDAGRNAWRIFTPAS